jgi:hypothetical protein
MKLLSFHPQLPFRNLPDWPVIFSRRAASEPPSGTASIRFLAGPNGVGKSNLLRFLTSIFAALDDDYSFPRPDNPAYHVPFRLSYELRDEVVTIDSIGRGQAGVTITIQRRDGTVDVNNSTRVLKPRTVIGQKVGLPSAVMVYTSGEVAAWRDLLRAPTTQFATEPDVDESPLPEYQLTPEEEFLPEESLSADNVTEPSGEDSTSSDQPDEFVPLRRERVLLVEPQHLMLALLVALLIHDRDSSSEARQDSFGRILQQVRVQDLVGFSLQLDFGNVNLSSPQRQLLQRLHAFTTLRVPSLPQATHDEQLWVFDMYRPQEPSLLDRMAHEEVQTPVTVFERPFLLFRMLLELQDIGVLKKTDLVITKGTISQSSRCLLATALSDGELAFLQRMALIHLLSSDECLFIFDEPDTHLNDTWRRDLIDHIEQTLGGSSGMGGSSEVILTTHASITLSDAYPNEVILLGEQGQEPVPLTLATEPDELLRSVFGADRSVGKRGQRKVLDAISMAENGDVEALRDLLNEVGPGYYRFKIVEALRRYVSPS